MIDGSLPDCISFSGSDEFGCLGRGSQDRGNSCTPQLVQDLLAVEVAAVAAGPTHVAVVSAEGEGYSWGHSACGALGLGVDSPPAIRATPTRVSIPAEALLHTVSAGPDATVWITRTGHIYACGSNTGDRLGLDARIGVLRGGKPVAEAWVPTRVNIAGKGRVASVAVGALSAVVVLDSGKCFELSNSRRPILQDHHVKAAGAGASFALVTAACTPHCMCPRKPAAAMAAATGPRAATAVFGWGPGFSTRGSNGSTSSPPAYTAEQPVLLDLADEEESPNRDTPLHVLALAGHGDSMMVLVANPPPPAVAALVNAGPAGGKSNVAGAGLALQPMPSVKPTFPHATPQLVPPVLPSLLHVDEEAECAQSGENTGTSVRTWLREELRLAAAEAITQSPRSLATVPSTVKKVPTKRVNVELDAELSRARKSRKWRAMFYF
jgi:hypothetical protein